MHSWLSVRFARTARVHDDSRQFAANRIKNLHSVGSVLSGIRTGAARFDNDRSAYRSVRGSLSGTLNAGAIHPAFPQEAPAATPVRSTTVTETPRSCRNHAVDNPTMPAPTTIADRGRIRLMSAICSGQFRRGPGLPFTGRRRVTLHPRFGCKHPTDSGGQQHDPADRKSPSVAEVLSDLSH